MGVNLKIVSNTYTRFYHLAPKVCNIDAKESTKAYLSWLLTLSSQLKSILDYIESYPKYIDSH